MCEVNGPKQTSTGCCTPERRRHWWFCLRWDSGPTPQLLRNPQAWDTERQVLLRWCVTSTSAAEVTNDWNIFSSHWWLVLCWCWCSLLANNSWVSVQFLFSENIKSLFCSVCSPTWALLSGLCPETQTSHTDGGGGQQRLKHREQWIDHRLIISSSCQDHISPLWSSQTLSEYFPDSYWGRADGVSLFGGITQLHCWLSPFIYTQDKKLCRKVTFLKHTCREQASRLFS